MTSLGSLPDDLLLDIVDQLDTARDVAHLSCLSRRTNTLIRQDGWKSFVKARFPSLAAPPGTATGWNALADRLTYQDRCFEKRGLSLTFLHEKRPKGPARHRQPGRQSVLCHSVLDALVVSSSQDELLAWGAGENLVVRLRPRASERQDAWKQLKGQEIGYFAGTGDITAISTIERRSVPEVLVGRANGDLQLLNTSAGKAFGQPTQNLLPLEENEIKVDQASSSARKSPGQLAVSWTEWQPEKSLLASCQSSVLTLYDLSKPGNDDLRPVAYYDVSRDSAAEETSLIRSAKFMSTDIIACALGGSREPLRWSQVLPTGLQFVSAAQNLDPLDRVATKTEVTREEKTTIRAIEPVGGGNLLLSAWEDGTLRLMDIRTPSAYDAVYRDRFQPYQASSSLLVYGTQRFVAGNNAAPDIRFFDFRSPRPYDHTTALPCSAESPYPSRSFLRGGSEAARDPADICDPWSGRKCTWHAQSASDSWRPDATMHFGDPAYDRVSSLTKASDGAASFYCGVRGAVVEANLTLAEDAASRSVYRTAPPGWTVVREGGVSLMETGVSLCSTDEWLREFNGVPKLFHQGPRPGPSDAQGQFSRSRLDAAFHIAGE